jgi:hypothetical protein
MSRYEFGKKEFYKKWKPLLEEFLKDKKAYVKSASIYDEWIALYPDFCKGSKISGMRALGSIMEQILVPYTKKGHSGGRVFRNILVEV